MKAFVCTYLRPASYLPSGAVKDTFMVHAEDLIQAKSKALAELNHPQRLKLCLSLLWIREA